MKKVSALSPESARARARAKEREKERKLEHQNSTAACRFPLLFSKVRSAAPLFCKGFCIFLGPISREKRKEKSNLKNRAFGFLNLLLARIGRSFSIRTETNEEERQRRDKRNAPGHVFYFCSHSPSLNRERVFE